ncbi:MAG: hypothetical protein F4Y31_02235 [Gammaproteobacteria bacterium]|nr:hypothetical protein [Gammaproteobacteria bacterium]MYK37384.1 hypothetical protein [Gammaproteobacteria bacterium]
MIPTAFKPCRIRLAALVCALWGSVCWGQQTAAAVKVEVAGGQGQYQLLRGGEPYVVKGAGAIVANYAELARRGGNSVRTWNIDMAQARLDQALEAGVTVSLCLPVVAPRYGFDYGDETFLVAQRTRVWAAVERYRDHPALLAWILGNELNFAYNGTALWDEINNLSRIVHHLDPNHPTTTAIAGLEEDVIRAVKERAPDLDFLSFQVYGALALLPEFAEGILSDTPFMITEWGPLGHWEVDATEWGAPIEQNSSGKAKHYLDQYRRFISPHLGNGLGSYAFLWGQKQERTPTWYSMFTYSGETTETMDALQTAWTGAQPANRAPRVKSLLLHGKNAWQNVTLAPGESYIARLSASDPDGDELRYQWALRPESQATAEGGDFEEAIEEIDGLIENTTLRHIVMRAPDTPGAYRLFVEIYDGKGHAGHANLPFRVQVEAARR